jgi:uncharacterized membrane protein
LELREERQIAILILVVLLIGLGGMFLTGSLSGLASSVKGGYGDIYVESYRADLYPNGTLEETFIYENKESGKYRMLYRIWQAPISLERLDKPYVEPISISPPRGTIPYTKDWRGEVKILSTTHTSYTGYIYDIRSLAVLNEAGCYKPEKFEAGEYKIAYIFRLHPALECDAEYCHLNLKLADEHLPYKHLTMAIHDPDGFVVQLFTHPPMDARKDGDTWIVTGESPKDALLEIEMLLKPEFSNVMDGFLQYVSDVKGKTLSANSHYSTTYSFLSALSYTLIAMVFFFPVMLALIYYKYGREKFFTVPKFLSYVPKIRKPWLVNLVFKGDAFNFDENGFYATLLDLQRRKIVKIETDGGKREGLRIKLLKVDEAVEDDYERQVLEFLGSYAENGVFDTETFEERIEGLKNYPQMGGDAMLSSVRDRMQGLIKVANKRVANEFVMSGRKHVAKLIALFFIVMLAMLFSFLNLGSVYPQLLSCLFSSFILFLQSIPPVFAPSALFGRWKVDYYKEKLEWDAFKTFLSDFASIQKYSPEDLNIWKEWLVYGTTLGVGDKVVKAMEELQVSIPDAHAAIYMPIYFGHAFRMTTPPTTGTEFGGIGGGGGFGAGGGFGGGGGGAR